MEPLSDFSVPAFAPSELVAAKDSSAQEISPGDTHHDIGKGEEYQEHPAKSGAR